MRQAAESARREQDDLLRLTTDAAPILLCYVDSAGRYRFANRAFREWYRLPAEGVIEATLAQTLGPEDYAPGRAAGEGGPGRAVAGIRDRPGQPARRGAAAVGPFAPDVTPALDVRGFVIVITDVTESRRARRRG